MKTIEEYINEWFYKPVIITKNIGNTGYFIRQGDFGGYHYKFVSKRDIIYIISCYEQNKRKVKLIALKILDE